MIAEKEDYFFNSFLLQKRFIENRATPMPGKQLTKAYLDQNGFEKPLLVKDHTGLGMKVPKADKFSLKKMEELVGGNFLVHVIDVANQQQLLERWRFADWLDYFRTPSKHPRERLYNLISLEFSKTQLNSKVIPPAVVTKQIGWVQQHFRPFYTNAMAEYPRVEKYCLMSKKGCFTDFHIDFGGSSVWYHILKGSKTFYLIPPTKDNLKAYEHWCHMKYTSSCHHSESSTEQGNEPSTTMGQNDNKNEGRFIREHSKVYNENDEIVKQKAVDGIVHDTTSAIDFENMKVGKEKTCDVKWEYKGKFLDELVEDVWSQELHAGDTFFLPTGWIHAVYTTEDCIAFGGNFLHGYNISLQLNCAGIEHRTSIGDGFRFPHFELILWRMAKFYYEKLKAGNRLCIWEKKGIPSLISRLYDDINGKKHNEIKEGDLRRLVKEEENRIVAQREKFSEALKHNGGDVQTPEALLFKLQDVFYGFCQKDYAIPKKSRENVFEKISCICGTNDDDGSHIIQCDNCSTWSHVVCNNLDPRSTMPDSFECESCLDSSKLTKKQKLN